jgi:ATP-binding cassette subfamily F protein uup
MAVIGMQNVSIGFGGRPLLENINLQINAGERICLLGRNGVGKTTFMKLIAGQVAAEKGDVARGPKITLACLMQDVPGNLQGTAFELVAEGLGECGKLLSEYHLVSHKLAEDHENPSLLKKLDAIHHAIDAQDGWQMDKYIIDIIKNMNLDADASAEGLSAGMKRRALLAQALVRKPDVLLLDEPTNHLDIKTIVWLEEFMTNYKGTLIFVSHDRAFVKKLATRIFEFDRGLITTYSCDYDTFLVRRDVANEAREKEQALFDKKLAAEEIWIRKGVKARRTRNEGRVRALKKMREERQQRREKIGDVRIQLQQVQQSGNLVIDAKNISFAYQTDKPLVSGFTTTIMRGDRIGIIGPNGSGKTTLLRLLLGEIQPKNGSVRHGTNLQIAYFDQLHAELDYDKCVYENIAGGNKTIEINGARKHIVGYLQDFLFTPQQCLSPLSNLSGGERNRLLLARLFTQPSNLLVMDEPTNDLDVETLDLLEEVLLDYPGTLLLVSHDRQFLNNVVTSIIEVEGNGNVNEYNGGYDDYLRQKAHLTKPQQEQVKPLPKTEIKPQVRKLSYKEKQELNNLPGIIEKLETEQQYLHAKMADPAIYKNGTEAAAVGAKAAEIKKLLDAAYARWQELEELK